VVLTITRAVLESVGYRVLTHAGASGCVAVILQEKPDLVLLDVNMPKLGGETIVKLFGKAQPNSATIILLFSTLSSEQLEQRAQLAGAHGFIRKTEDSFELVRQVNTWLRPKDLVPKQRSPSQELRAQGGTSQSGQRKRTGRSSPPGAAKSPRVSRPPPKTSGTSKVPPIVLFVDDMDGLSTLRRSTQGEAYTADFALSVGQALRHLEGQRRPDAVIANIELGGMQLYERAIEMDRDFAQRFVFLVPEERSEQTDEFLKTFFGVVLTRPFDDATLLETLRRVLSSRLRPAAHGEDR
jgi:CheY-like chemotaxis protein